ncbi:PREDICTED: protein FAM57B [Nanorana parkeri]|uniref:protein FAM57B n=1 Tax=Nanorana parkeri TaxID=125878 RepID=UPI0008550C90|nr:PREDICTED: protein FAM57B [Nanorana parkeri]
MVLVLAAGSAFFPGLFLLARAGLRGIPTFRGDQPNTDIVAARLVSSIQAVLASTAGYIVASSCKDVIEDQHWLAATYTRFAVPYFIYDIYAMYLCYWHKHKVKGHTGGCELLKGYLHKEFLMVLHHVFMVLVCFPVSVLWREGKGDFFLGCMLMAELSTPFVCLGKVLIQYKKQHTLLHRVNGVIMLVTFFSCRLLLFPYMYWVYGQRVGLPLYKVPFSLSAEYNLGAAILMAPQVYWFYLICRRAYSLFLQSVMSQRPKNGHPAADSPSAKDQDCSQ